jgi:cell division protein FtsL
MEMANAKTAYGRVIAPRRLEAVLEGKREEYLPALLGILALLTIVSIFHVWSRVKVVDLNLQLGESRKQYKEMQQEQSRLKLEVASLKTPARIAAVAHQGLGLSLPTNQQVVQVR